MDQEEQNTIDGFEAPLESPKRNFNEVDFFQKASPLFAETSMDNQKSAIDDDGMRSSPDRQVAKEEQLEEGEEGIVEDLNSDALLEAYERANGTPQYKRYMQKDHEIADDEKVDSFSTSDNVVASVPVAESPGEKTFSEDPIAVYESLRKRKEQMKASGTYTLENDPFVVYSSKKAERDKQEKQWSATEESEETSEAGTNDQFNQHDDDSIYKTDRAVYASIELSPENTENQREESDRIREEIDVEQKVEINAYDEKLDDQEKLLQQSEDRSEKVIEKFASHSDDEPDHDDSEEKCSSIGEESTSQGSSGVREGESPSITMELKAADYSEFLPNPPKAENFSASNFDGTAHHDSANHNIPQSDQKVADENDARHESAMEQRYHKNPSESQRSANEQLQEILHVNQDSIDEKRDTLRLYETERAAHMRMQKEYTDMQVELREEISNLKLQLSVANSGAEESRKKLEECMRANASLAGRMEAHEDNIGKDIIKSMSELTEHIQLISKDLTLLRSDIKEISAQLEKHKESEPVGTKTTVGTPTKSLPSVSEALLKLSGVKKRLPDSKANDTKSGSTKKVEESAPAKKRGRPKGSTPTKKGRR